MRILKLAIALLLIAPSIFAGGGRNFTVSTTDKIDCGAGASITDFTALTCMIWFFSKAANASSRFLASKENSFEKEFNLRPNTQLEGFARGTGTNSNARGATTSGNVAANGVWTFYAFTVDSSLVPRLYIGDSTTTAHETAYATQTTGGLPFITESGKSFIIGNGATLTSAPDAIIASVMYFNSALTLNEIKEQQFYPHAHPNLRLWHNVGFAYGSSTQDESGFANHGTITGTTDSTLNAPNNFYGGAN